VILSPYAKRVILYAFSFIYFININFTILCQEYIVLRISFLRLEYVDFTITVYLFVPEMQIAGKLVNIKLHIQRSHRVVRESRSLCTCECRVGNITRLL
jgi:hypothetical protein